jgi:teichuronic acid biosynthesis glycosyltransferase TuaC
MTMNTLNPSIRVLAVSRNFPNPLRPYEGTWAYTQFKALQECGAEVRVLSPRASSLSMLKDREDLRYHWSRPQSWTYRGLPVYGPKFVYWLAGGAFRHTYAFQTYLGLRRKLDRFRREWPFNAIFTQAIDPDAAAAVRWARRHEDVVTAGCIIGQAEVTQRVEDPKIRRLVVETLNSLDVVVAESASVAASAEDLLQHSRPVYPLLRGSFPEDIRILPEIQDQWRAQWSLPKDTVICMFVGHLYTAKGVYDLLDAFRDIAASYPQARLVYVGKGDQESGLKAQVSRYGLEHKVIFTGVVPFEQVPTLMSLSDFICSPSHYEGLGVVNVEAGFVGKPVIGARTGGIPEVVCDGRTGLLFEPKNVQELSQKIRLLIDNESLRKEMGRNATAFVTECHNAHHNTKLLYDLLIEARRKKRSRHA